MGILDLFKRGPKDGGLSKHTERTQNKRAQAADRWESIQALGKIGGPEAVTALLPRFNFHVEPSISDQDEKEAAFALVVSAPEDALEPVRKFMHVAPSIAWPLKILKEIQSEEQVTAFLLEILAEMDVEYERDPERKLQLLAELEQRSSDDLAATVKPFLEDVNETARFHAAGAILAQQNANEFQSAVEVRLATEESVRVKIRIADAFVKAGWSLGEESRGALPEGFRADSKGRVQKR